LGDLKSFQARYIALHQSIIDDGMRHKVPFHVKDLQTVLERIQNEGSSFAQVTLPLLGKALDQGLVSGRFTPIANFRLKRNTCLPILCNAVFREVFDDEGILLSNPTIVSIYFLRQFLLLDSKLIFEPTLEMKKLAVQGFSDRQNVLRKVRIQTDHPVLIRARWLLGRVLKGLDLSDIEPGHGPGIVADGWDRFERWDFTSWPARAEHCYPFGVYGAHTFEMASRNGIGIPLIKRMTTKCCLVPKDFKGPRLISAEGTVNQYLQQGQMKSLMRYIDNHPILKRSIQLRDQTLNQRKAATAVDHDLVTLDLSNASDSVSTSLVWFLLSKVPRLRRQLMSTRSEYMRHDDTFIRLVAFSPMGSAVCFPVETLVFWAISMASLMLVRPRYERTPRLRSTEHEFGMCSSTLSELASEICVFGDDIIAPRDCLSTLMTTLTSVGCQVNASKTCYETPFRESCGSEWFKNTDVTIIRNRRYSYDANKFIGDYPVLLGLQRKFFLRGLYSTAELLCQWAREIYPVVTVSINTYRENYQENGSFARSANGLSNLESSPESYNLARPRDRASSSKLFRANCFADFFSREKFAIDSYTAAIGWDNECDNSLPVRFNRDYQRMEFRCPAEFQVSKTWSTDGYARLLARISSDKTERIALRDRKIRMAWSFLPFYSKLSTRNRLV
jgi:hypothetical protein